MTYAPASSKYPARYRMMIKPQLLVPCHGDLSFSQKLGAAKSFAYSWAKYGITPFCVKWDNLTVKMFQKIQETSKYDLANSSGLINYPNQLAIDSCLD
jgi:hypothetical protein